MTPVVEGGQQAGFDFIALLADTRFAVKVIYYKTETPQPALLDQAARALCQAARKSEVKQAMLVVSCALDPTLREQLETNFEIVFVDRIDLSIMSAVAPLERARLGALLAASMIPETRQRWEARDAILSTSPPPPAPSQSNGADLCKELKGLRRGKGDWREYEGLCCRILKYLFPLDLAAHRKQQTSNDRLNRYDLICRVEPTTAFWRFVDERLSSRYVLFEFKNYNAKITPHEVLSTERYLLPRALRSVAFVLSRDGANERAAMMAMGAMREAGKVILILSDADLCRMLHARDRGEDPSDLLFDTTDEFLMQINR